MNVNLINPFLAAFIEVLPQIGFQKIEKGKVSLVEATLDNKGLMVNIALIGQIKGAVLIGFDINSAKNFASKMMMGMEVSELNQLAQSALAEMGNMVCANACTQFAKTGISGLDISPPTLMIGQGGKVLLSVPKVISVNFIIDDIAVDIYLGIMQ